MRAFRRLAIVAAAVALTAPLGIGPTAGAAPQPAPAAGQRTGVYISPWGSAHVDLSAEARRWIEDENIKVGAIAPFTLDATGYGFDMPIGSTAGDHLDEKGRIFYPGGMTFTLPDGHVMRLEPTWIRVMPTPLWSSGLSMDGRKEMEELPVASTSYAEVLASGRPTFSGFRLDHVPFHVTQEAADAIAKYTGRPAPAAGSLLGTLTPNFDYSGRVTRSE